MSSEEAAGGCIGCVAIVLLGGPFLLLLFYIFSDSSVGALKDVSVAEMLSAPNCVNCERLLEPLPTGFNVDDGFIELLEGNSKVSELTFQVMAPFDGLMYAAQKYKNEQPQMLTMLKSLSGYDRQEMEKQAEFQDAVVLSFIYDNKFQCDYVFLVIKGHFWKILKSLVMFDGGILVLRPWASYGTMISASSKPII